MKRNSALVLTSVVVVSAVATSVVVVRPGEAVVVRRFGRALERPWTPGLHFGLPWGAERRDVVRIDEVRKLEIGSADDSADPDVPPGEGEFLTADGNFVRAKAVVQYRVDSPSTFVVSTIELERLMVRASESALSRAFSHQTIDQLLVSGRARASIEIAEELDRRLPKRDLGIAILNVNLTEIRPPSEVLAEFNDAQAAASERERRERDAGTEASLRRSRGESRANALVEAAKAGSDRVRAIAKGRASSFAALAARAEKSRELTMRRLYADAVDELLPKVGRKVVNAGAGIDLGVYGVDK